MVASDSLNEVETTVVVFVRDVNDMPPEFEKNLYVTSMSEESVLTDRPLLQVDLRPPIKKKTSFYNSFFFKYFFGLHFLVVFVN